jgi:hypothetical protein
VVTPPHRDFGGAVLLMGHRELRPVMGLDRRATPRQRAAPSPPSQDQQAILHRGAGVSRRSNTCCSTARERMTSNRSWSASAMISMTRCRTWAAVSGAHWRSLASNCSAKASIVPSSNWVHDLISLPCHGYGRSTKLQRSQPSKAVDCLAGQGSEQLRRYT